MSDPSTLRSRDAAELSQEVQDLRAEVRVLRNAQAEAAREIEALNAKVRARDEFIAIAAHELRNPMSAIILYVQNIRIACAKLDPPLPAAIAERLARLERRVEHFIKRASTLLDVSRLSSEKMIFELEPVDLSALAREVAAQMAQEMNAARSPLLLALEDGVVGRWDRLALEQILSNLLSNAVKYGAGKPIELRLATDATAARLAVRDEGIGISQEDQTRIFQKFERAVKRQEHGGFGVGLWIVRQIAAGLGGQISVQSEPGQGSTFVVTLPREPSLK